MNIAACNLLIIGNPAGKFSIFASTGDFASVYAVVRKIADDSLTGAIV
jgi:hypothetical protein